VSKQELVTRLRRELQRAAALRQPAAGTDDVAARLSVKRFQSERMASTHSDLLAAADSKAAALFFLNDLYGQQNPARRDSDIERIVPAMEKLLPASALATVAEALSLDALSEELDAAMAAQLGTDFSMQNYSDAYRSMPRLQREKQLALVASLGKSLSELVDAPLIGRTLKLMRGPAKLAGLSTLQQFLERGFDAFRQLHQPQAFVDVIVARERIILENLYAGKSNPFNVTGHAK